MTGANLARAMQLTPPTVHEMLRSPGAQWLDPLLAASSRSIEFTDAGRAHAENLVGRHRMIERFLTDVVGVPWDDVHEEAEKLEYAMTPRFEAYVRVVRRRRQDLPGRPSDPGARAGGRACRSPTARSAPR